MACVKSREQKLTRTVADTILLHLRCFAVLASLVGAISNTIGEPRVVAVAANIARLASELALGNTNHVCYAGLLEGMSTCGAIGRALSMEECELTPH